MTERVGSRLEDSLQRFDQILTPDERQEIISLQEQPLPTGIRVNPLKVHPRQFMQDLAQRYGWEVAPVSFCSNAWAIHKAETPPGNTLEHRMGQYYLQDVASLVPGSLFDFNRAHSSPLVLDMAASPGGKTTHLIARSRDHGLVIANDASQSRIPALRSVLSAWGGINQIITQYPGEIFGAWYPETFDIILLDAPCSMENLRPTAAHPLRETTSTERIRLQERQVQLLTSGLAALVVGGQMVYATCSLAPEEDEVVLDKVLRSYPGAVRIEPGSDRLSISAPALAHFGEQAFHSDVSRALRLWPHRTGMSGFFCALLQKTAKIPVQKEPPPFREFAKTGLNPLHSEEQQQLVALISQQFGLDLEQVLAEHLAVLHRRYGQVFLIPQIYLEKFSDLPYEWIGMPLGQFVADEWVPSHEFISRFGHQFTRGMIHISEEYVSQWISGRDIRHPHTALAPHGQYLLVMDQAERNLGLGKLLPKRLRNMLPHRSR